MRGDRTWKSHCQLFQPQLLSSCLQLHFLLGIWVPSPVSRGGSCQPSLEPAESPPRACHSMRLVCPLLPSGDPQGLTPSGPHTVPLSPTRARLPFPNVGGGAACLLPQAPHSERCSSVRSPPSLDPQSGSSCAHSVEGITPGPGQWGSCHPLAENPCHPHPACGGPGCISEPTGAHSETPSL